MAELAEWWLDVVARHRVRASTLGTYSRRVERISNTIGQLPARSLKPERIARWQSDLLRSGLASGTRWPRRCSIRHLRRNPTRERPYHSSQDPFAELYYAVQTEWIVKLHESPLAALTGCDASVQDIGKGIFDRTRPGLIVEVDEYRHPNAPDVRLIIIGVSQGTQVYSVAGRVTLRMGTDCQALSPAEVHRLYSSRLNLDLSAEPTDLGIEAVSASAMEIARRRLRAMPEAGREVADLPLGELLRNLELVDDSGWLRRAGALLLTTPAEDVEASLVYVHRQRASAEPDYSTRLDGTLLEVAERAIELVRVRRHERNLLLPSGQQITVADFPEPAAKEAAQATVTKQQGGLFDQ